MKKRLLTIISIMMMAVLMLVSMGMTVFAEDLNYEENGLVTKNIDLKANAESRSATSSYLGMETTSVELIDPTTLEALDPSIATANFTNTKYGSGVKFTFKKAGKVYYRVNYIDRRQNDTYGKSFFLVGAYNVIEKTYSSPVKTLKLGKINMTKKLGHSEVLTGKAFKGKVTYKAKSGWKLTKAYKYIDDSLVKMGKNRELINLKISKTITLKKGERLVLVFKKGNKTASVCYKAK